MNINVNDLNRFADQQKSLDVFGKSCRDVQKKIVTYLTYDERLKAARASKVYHNTMCNISTSAALVEARRLNLTVKNPEDCRQELAAFKRNFFVLQKLRFICPQVDDYFNTYINWAKPGQKKYQKFVTDSLETISRTAEVAVSYKVEKLISPAVVKEWSAIKNHLLLYEQIEKYIKGNREELELKLISFLLDKKEYANLRPNIRVVYTMSMLHFEVMGNDFKRWQALLYALHGLHTSTYDAEGVCQRSLPYLQKWSDWLTGDALYGKAATERTTAYTYALDLFLSNSIIPAHAKSKALQRLLSDLLKHGKKYAVKQLIARGIVPSENNILQFFKYFPHATDLKVTIGETLCVANDLMKNTIKTMSKAFQRDLLELFRQNEEWIALRIIEDHMSPSIPPGKSSLSVSGEYGYNIEIMFIQFQHFVNHFQEMEKSLGALATKPEVPVEFGIQQQFSNLLDQKKKSLFWKKYFEILLNKIKTTWSAETDIPSWIKRFNYMFEAFFRSRLPSMYKTEIFQELRKLISGLPLRQRDVFIEFLDAIPKSDPIYALKEDVFGKSSSNMQKLIVTYLNYEERLKAAGTSKTYRTTMSKISAASALVEANRLGLVFKNSKDCLQDVVAFKRDFFVLQKLRFIIPKVDEYFYHFIDRPPARNYLAFVHKSNQLFIEKTGLLQSQLIDKKMISPKLVKKWREISNPSLLYEEIRKDIRQNRAELAHVFIHSFLKNNVFINHLYNRDTYAELLTDLVNDFNAMLHFDIMSNDLKRWQELLYVLNGLEGFTYNSEGIIQKSSPKKQRELRRTDDDFTRMQSFSYACRPLREYPNSPKFIQQWSSTQRSAEVDYYEHFINERIKPYIHALDLFLSNLGIPQDAKSKALQRLLSDLLKNGHRFAAGQLLMRGILPSENDILGFFSHFLGAKIPTCPALVLANDLMENGMKTLSRKTQIDLLELFRKNEDVIALRIIEETLFLEPEVSLRQRGGDYRYDFFGLSFIEFNHLRNSFQEIEKGLEIEGVKPGMLEDFLKFLSDNKRCSAWKKIFKVLFEKVKNAGREDEDVWIQRFGYIVKECLRSQLSRSDKAEIVQALRKSIDGLPAQRNALTKVLEAIL